MENYFYQKLMLIVIFFIIIISSCSKGQDNKEEKFTDIDISIINADNYQNYLEQSFDYSLDEFDNGFTHIGSFLGILGAFTKTVKSVSPPWKVENKSNKGRVVTYRNEETGEEYQFFFFSAETDKIAEGRFSHLPMEKYLNDVNYLIKEKGYIYRSSNLNKNLLIKKVKTGLFTIIKLDELKVNVINRKVLYTPTGEMKFEIYKTITSSKIK